MPPPASLELCAITAGGDAFSVVSHELRTPVTCINGYLALLLEEDIVGLGDSTGQYLEVIERNSVRLLHSVRDLRFLADLDADRLCWDVEWVSVPAVVARAVGAARPRAERAGVEVQALTPPCAPWSGDPERLAHLLDNLISNALKFTCPGGSVQVTLRPGPTRVWLEVKDEGEGIDARDRDRVFERFFRAASAVETATQGTGIGLTVAAEIARAHGGRIDVAAEPGAGTTVGVDLPYVAA